MSNTTSGFCGTFSTFLTGIVASLIFIAGIGGEIYGLWMLSDDANGFSVFVCGFGAYTLLVGLVGICLACCSGVGRCRANMVCTIISSLCMVCFSPPYPSS